MVQASSALAMQEYFHHGVVTSILFLGLLGGMHMPKLIVVVLLCEFSTIFLHIREMHGKYEWKGLVSNINSVVFFLTFTVVRPILFPLAILSHIKMGQLYNFSEMSLKHKAIYWVDLLLFISLFALNLFWYLLILKGLVKLFKKEKKENEGEYVKFQENGPVEQDDKDGLLQNTDEKL